MAEYYIHRCVFVTAFPVTVRPFAGMLHSPLGAVLRPQCWESVWYQRDEAHSEFWDVLFFWTDGAKTKLSLEVDYDVSHQQLTHFAGESVVQKMNQNTTREFVSHIKTLLEP